MTRFSRRAYLSGALAAVVGTSGVAAAQPDEADRGQPRGGPQAASTTCPPGTTLLASYEPQRGDDDVTLEHVDGEDVVSFESIESGGGGRVDGFDWTSSTPVALVELEYGPHLDEFDGGFEGRVERSGGPRIDAVRFCAPRGGRAHVADVDLDLSFENELHRARPGDEAEAGDVLHVQSVDTGDPTRDYALSAVNLLQRRADESQIVVDDLETLSFDYYRGPDDGGVVPDGVFVVLLPDADDGQLRIAWDQAAEESDESWETFDVLEQLDEAVWRVVTVGFDDLHSGGDVLGAALQLRDDPEQREVTLAEEYTDATLAGVAVGAGSTSDPTTVDRYYDSLVVGTPDVDDRFRFPATVPADVEVEADGPEIVTTLSLAEDETDLSLEDVDEDAVTLATYGPVAPPIDSGVRPRDGSVEVEGDELRVGFQRGRVQQLLNRQSVGEFLVSADLDVDDGSAVYGVGEWD